jgi:hypothetical protein
VLVIADAANEAAVDRCLADGPWVLSQHLVTTSVEPFTALVGAERLATRAPQT